MPKTYEYVCTICGAMWLGKQLCPNGCGSLAKSNGEFTKKTFQGTDNDLKKSGR